MDFAHSESAGVVRGALGSVLRTRREAARRTLSEIAAEAGLSPAHLSEVERGRKEVSIERLIAVAHALGARPAEIGVDQVTVRMPADGAYLSVLRTATAGLAARLDFTLDDIEDMRIAVD